MSSVAAAADAVPRRLRLGMVGGGRGSFIGASHRLAARFDDRYALVAGVLSGDAKMAAASAADLHLDPARCYADFAAMAKGEAARADGIEVVAIAVPNHLHHPAAKAFLEAGIDVICDKPLATSLADARDLASTAERLGRFLGVTYNYSGYPMARQARALIEDGALGQIRLVHVEFVLGWLSAPVEAQGGGKQAEWRTDPRRSGPSLVVADLGTHCLHLAEFVSGCRLARLAADLETVVAGRQLEDDAQILLRFDNGARGMMWTSMVAAGETVGLRLRVYGEKGHVAWNQSRPDDLVLALADGVRILTRGGPGLSPAARRATHIVAGLPEGFHDAFAVLYRDYADIIVARRTGQPADPLTLLAPTGADGMRGCAFVEAALASRQAGGGWVDLPAGV
jgi:predicted dehydrogenase